MPHDPSAETLLRLNAYAYPFLSDATTIGTPEGVVKTVGVEPKSESSPTTFGTCQEPLTLRVVALRAMIAFA